MYGAPGMVTSVPSSAVIWMYTPVFGPPLCNWPVLCRNRGPNAERGGELARIANGDTQALQGFVVVVVGSHIRHQCDVVARIGGVEMLWRVRRMRWLPDDVAVHTQRAVRDRGGFVGQRSGLLVLQQAQPSCCPSTPCTLGSSNASMPRCAPATAVANSQRKNSAARSYLSTRSNLITGWPAASSASTECRTRRHRRCAAQRRAGRRSRRQDRRSARRRWG